jgi:hypothetical protein
MTELRKLCSTLDPFQLANRIDSQAGEYLRFAQPVA